MTYPSQEEVRTADPLLEWIDEQFLRLDPFAFAAVGFRPMVSKIARELEVDANGIYCVGSGAIGLSVNPMKVSGQSLRAFSEKSDLDIAVISERHFETAWRELREATQPSLDVVDSLIDEHLRQQKKRFFDGAIMANKLLPAFSFGRDSWLAAHVRIEQYAAELLNREVDVNMWIYRDYWSLRNYVSEGIIKCRGRLA